MKITVCVLAVKIQRRQTPNTKLFTHMSTPQLTRMLTTFNCINHFKLQINPNKGIKTLKNQVLIMMSLEYESSFQLTMTKAEVS